MNYWLLKSEADVYSIDDLKRDKTTIWDNIRNYRARNIMRTEMKPGDLFLFYYSMGKNGSNGVAGIGKILSVNLPDMSALDKQSEYFDPKASREKNPWVAIKVGFVTKFKYLVPLDVIKDEPKLKNMVLLKIARLSVQPVKREEFDLIRSLGSKKSA
ncbi:MAG TPA: EVE domain-containing protein [Methylomirabilota bacterium]|jgi:predicted RNA-binding protein with PUA-like domain|nr:EVE domain-containing protein [Methylomirabilota bacterium]